jgi:N-dimethylarginine dimethylaminohydrolase
MSQAPRILLVDPAHFTVGYVINPWMQPSVWAEDPALHRRRARSGFDALREALARCGAHIETIEGVEGLPDMVFPANAAVVLDGRALVARFACSERQGEEPVFYRALQSFVERGVLREVAMLPEGCFQEGAGDAIWDSGRNLFWAGHGQRSTLAGVREVERFFGRDVVPLTLATAQFYHLDTCFCPLSGGEVLYYPPAFAPESLAAIHARVAPAQRLEASREDAAAFCVNAVNIGRDIVMAQPPASMRRMLEERGYRVQGVELAPFILSGGGAYCMTLRLDRGSKDGTIF